MIYVNEILKYWRDDLKPLLIDVEQSCLQSEISNFLTTVGLPISQSWEGFLTFRFHIVPALQRKEKFKDDYYYIIGHDGNLRYFSKIAISCDSGAIYVLSQDEIKTSVEFVNSSIESFLMSMIIIIEYSKQLHILLNDNYIMKKEQLHELRKMADELTDEVKLKLNEIDFKALETKNTYWSDLLSHVRLLY